VQAEKTEITERVSKIVFMDARLSKAVASWQGNLLIDVQCHHRMNLPCRVELGLRLSRGFSRANDLDR
jgi:hypothetical protein